MTINKVAAIALVVGSLGASGSALAQSTGWYVGGGIGKSSADIDTAGINASIIRAGGAGVTGVATGTDDNDTGFKLFAGYQLNPNFAVEVGYADLGKFSFISTVAP